MTIMDITVSTANFYWNILKYLNRDVKLLLASRLTASVVKEEKTVHKEKTAALIKEFCGCWEGNTSAEETIHAIESSKLSKQEPLDL